MRYQTATLELTECTPLSLQEKSVREAVPPGCPPTLGRGPAVPEHHLTAQVNPRHAWCCHHLRRRTRAELSKMCQIARLGLARHNARPTRQLHWRALLPWLPSSNFMRRYSLHLSRYHVIPATTGASISAQSNIVLHSVPLEAQPARHHPVTAVVCLQALLEIR
jgi:uncharacterized protein YjiS (DUF1127 family)